MLVEPPAKHISRARSVLASGLRCGRGRQHQLFVLERQQGKGAWTGFACEIPADLREHEAHGVTGAARWNRTGCDPLSELPQRVALELGDLCAVGQSLLIPNLVCS